MLKLVYDATAGTGLALTIPGIKAAGMVEIPLGSHLQHPIMPPAPCSKCGWMKSTGRKVACDFPRPGSQGRPANDRSLEPGGNAGPVQNPHAPQRGLSPARARPWCFDRYFHRLQNSASIPRKQHFGLHAIRKTAATILAGFSPRGLAIRTLGHGSWPPTMNITSIPRRLEARPWTPCRNRLGQLHPDHPKDKTMIREANKPGPVTAVQVIPGLQGKLPVSHRPGGAPRSP